MRKRLNETDGLGRRMTRGAEPGLRTRPEFSDARPTRALLKISPKGLDLGRDTRGHSVTRAPELRPIFTHEEFLKRDSSPTSAFAKKSTVLGKQDISKLNTSRNGVSKSITRAVNDKNNSLPARSKSALKRMLPLAFDPVKTPASSLRDSQPLRPKQPLARVDEKLAFLLRERFVPQKVLGQGAYSTIYLGLSVEDTGRRVALKVVRNNKKSVTTEFQILRALDHETIIKAEDLIIDEPSNQTVLVLELAGERTLSDVQKLLEGQVFSEPKAILYFMQIAKAVSHAHSRNIVHSDLKTENVVFVDESRVKLIDFGFARVVDGLAPDAICGTLGYLSPQQLRKLPFCPFKADVWSLGVVLYKMLFNLYPIKAKSMDEAASKLKGFKLALPAFRKVSAVTRNILSLLLTVDEAKRPSIDNVIAEFSFLDLP